MSFYKAYFPIQMNELVDKKIEVVYGWIDTENSFGYYRYGKKWKATDLVSGSLICTGSTRKECVEWIKNNKAKIYEVYNTKKYRNKVENFRLLIKKELHDE